MLVPGRKVPKLQLPTLDHGPFDLKAPGGANGTLLFFYRGGHSALCVRQMKEAELQFRSFEKIGVGAVFLSADDMWGAQVARDHAESRRLQIAYSLPLVAARDEWQLAISQGREGSRDPAFFIEPAVFLVTPERRLHSAWMQTQAHARPRLEHLIAAVKVAVESDLPVRGAYVGKLPGEA